MGVTPGLYPIYIRPGTDGQIYHPVLHLNFLLNRNSKSFKLKASKGSSPGSRAACSLPARADRGHPQGPWGLWIWPEGWAGLTFTLPAFPLVAWLAEAFVGLGRVLADGINVAVVRALRALVHVDGPCWGGGTMVRCGQDMGSQCGAGSSFCLLPHHGPWGN